MCRVPVQLRELVKQRLAAAAEEIFELLEKTITEYEEHLVSKYEQQRLQGALYTPDGGFPLQDQCEAPHIKEEQDVTHTPLCSGLKTDEPLSAWNTSTSPLHTQPGVASVPESEEGSGVSVKTEDGGTWTPPLHHTQTVPLPPPGGAVLQHSHTVSPPPGGAVLQHAHTVSPPPGGAVLQHSHTVSPPPGGAVLQHAHTVSPPPGGAVLQHSQTKEELLAQDVWTDEQVDLNRTLDCASPLCPPGGAAPHQVSAGKVRKRRGDGLFQKRPHQCPLCGLRFQSHFNLETHLRVHTGERPFSCPVCQKTFNRKDSMANHMKIHLGETFCCSECGKRYSDKSNLRRHALSMHAGKGHLSRPAGEAHHATT